MDTYVYAFPRDLGSGDDPFIEFIEMTNNQFPRFFRRVIDGGAGTGSFTDRVVKSSADCTVIDYEPLPENAIALRSRFNGVPSVEIREAALGERLTDVSFKVPEREGLNDHIYWVPGTSYGGYVSKPGFLPLVKSGFLPVAKHLAKKVLRRGNPPQFENITVEMVRLDDELNSAPDIVKRDLQGGEPDAVGGMGSLLAQVKVVKVEVLLKGGMGGQGAAKSRCIRALRDAGFALLVEDWQFHVPQMTDGLRRALADHGMEIEREVRLDPSHREVMVKGTWPTGRPLPIQKRRQIGKLKAVELTREFADALSEAMVSYFSVDLIALNGRYAQQWKSILSPDSLKQSGMTMDGQTVR